METALFVGLFACFEAFEKWPLRWKNLAARLLGTEPPGAVYFGKLLHATRSRRPLHREGIALQTSDVEVPAHRPRVDDLAPRLADGAQRDRSAGGRLAPELFLKLAPRNIEGDFVLLYLTFRDRPCLVVALFPEGSTRMDQQDFGRSLPLSVEQETGRLSGQRAMPCCRAAGRPRDARVPGPQA